MINVFGATFSNTETSEVNFIKNCKLERKETNHFIKNQLVNKRCDGRNDCASNNCSLYPNGTKVRETKMITEWKFYS